MGRVNLRVVVVVVIVAIAAALYFGRHRNVGDGPYAQEVADAVPRIEKSTGMVFKTPPRVEVRDKEQVRAFLIKKFDESSPASELAGEEAAYKLFGLLPDTLDLRKFFLAVLTEQVIGYYDPAAKVLYVVKGADEKTVGITITHELVHALQDQYVNLDSLQKSTIDSDKLSALQAVIEGQAMFEQMSIMAGGPSNIALRVGGRDGMREMIRESQSSQPVFATAPMVIQESLLFPYLSGADFVQRFSEQRGKANPLANVPRSTEQILHTAAYFGTPPDEPSVVTLPAPHGATKVYESDMGEFGTRLFLYQHLKDEKVAQRSATGWDGDRYVVVKNGTAKGIVWASVWDSTVEAASFSDALIRATTKRTGAAERVEAAGGATIRPKGRTITVFPRIISGRAVVIYSDLPDGMSGIIDPAAIKVDPH
ncbi:MAG: hypothetical protein M3Z05_05410 [Gemmatimonadota bacterium]|nr:hypothetical protein [Gemmatimonadota bacterium]